MSLKSINIKNFRQFKELKLDGLADVTLIGGKNGAGKTSILEALTYYTLIETAKANNIDPYKYILHLCKHIASVTTAEEVEALLPWNVKEQLAPRISIDA